MKFHVHVTLYYYHYHCHYYFEYAESVDTSISTALSVLTIITSLDVKKTVAVADSAFCTEYVVSLCRLLY